ncbi:MAG: polysaccharide biosynthesis/export family protein [Candidatus Omnitrophica bacterium]|nr:polysaccharide biosynthesis/export family protein [Candidatus Omnitrophota bacterium]
MNRTKAYLSMTALILFWPTLTWAQNFAGTGPATDQAQQSEILLAPAPEMVTATVAETPGQEQPIAEDIPVLFEGSSQYTLGKTDIIEVSVQRHPEVSGQYMINNEGKIQYEFVGDVPLEGMTKDLVRDKLTELLSVYIVSPEVTVKIAGYNSKVVYVIGEVQSPGKIFMRGDTITVREALVQAGLPLLTASTKKGKLITPSDNGSPDTRKVNISALLYKGDLRENYVMKPGDTLYVPATGLTKVMRTISPVTAPISNAASTGRQVYTGGF